MKELLTVSTLSFFLRNSDEVSRTLPYTRSILKNRVFCGRDKQYHDAIAEYVLVYLWCSCRPFNLRQA